MKPIRESYENKLAAGLSGDRFTHYELQSVREYEAPDGARFFEMIHDEADMGDDEPSGQAVGPALVGLYGRLNKGGVEHIKDFYSADDARETLRRMGVIS